MNEVLTEATPKIVVTCALLDPWHPTQETSPARALVDKLTDAPNAHQVTCFYPQGNMSGGRLGIQCWLVEVQPKQAATIAIEPAHGGYRATITVLDEFHVEAILEQFGLERSKAK